MAIKINESGTLKEVVSDGFSQIECKTAKGETYVTFNFTVAYYLVCSVAGSSSNTYLIIGITDKATSSEQTITFNSLTGGTSISITYTNSKIKTGWSGNTSNTRFIAFG